MEVSWEEQAAERAESPFTIHLGLDARGLPRLECLEMWELWLAPEGAWEAVLMS